jgi:predicted negative regulator of RcsB-dependent stress response
MSNRPEDAPESNAASVLNPNSALPPDADVEEKFNNFWKENGVAIFGGIALGGLAVVGVQLFGYFSGKAESAVREAFAQTITVEDKVQFAEVHAEHSLGAIALLQVADTRFEEGAFAEAATRYEAAAARLEEPSLRARARLGEAASLLFDGQVAAGQAQLEALAQDSEAMAEIRSEAAYHLAVTYWQADDLAKVDVFTEVILTLDEPVWVSRATALRERLGLDSAVSGES